MSSLANKQIVLGITGGIAAYKSAELVRRLRDSGASVRVVMTAAAQAFITPLTLQALSGNPVASDLLDPGAEAAMGHIELARWADLVVIAPASADFIAKLAHGEGSDLLSTLCLATRAKIALAPAMNQAMWANQATQDNLATLAARGFVVWGPASGAQACGEVGPGRMEEVETLAAACGAQFASGLLAGRRVLITAGPTREALDPVRYLSNHSSGKMGYALAEAACEAGALTTLISGPVNLPAPERVHRVMVESALEMHAAALQHAPTTDIFVGAAAVADYRPATVAPEKIKKGEHELSRLELVRNPDIIAAVAALDGAPFCVGFAAETREVEAYARAKLAAKGLDLIVANDVSAAGIGFNSDDNAVTVVSAAGEQRFERCSKRQLARDLVALVAARYSESKKALLRANNNG